MFCWCGRVAGQSTPVDVLQLILHTEARSETYTISHKFTVDRARVSDGLTRYVTSVEDAGKWLPHVVTEELARIRRVHLGMRTEPAGRSEARMRGIASDCRAPTGDQRPFENVEFPQLRGLLIEGRAAAHAQRGAMPNVETGIAGDLVQQRAARTSAAGRISWPEHRPPIMGQDWGEHTRCACGCATISPDCAALAGRGKRSIIPCDQWAGSGPSD